MLCRILRGKKEPSEPLVFMLVNCECHSEVGGVGDTTGESLSVDCLNPKRSYPEHVAQRCAVSNNARAFIS